MLRALERMLSQARPPRDAIKLASSVGAVVASNVFVRLLSIVTMPLLTQLLPPSAYGTAAMIGALISFASVTALAGADVSYMRASSSSVGPRPEAVETLVWRFAVSAGGLAAAVTFAVIWYAASYYSWPVDLAWLSAVGVFASIFQTMAQTRTRIRGNHRALAWATMLSGTGSILLGLILAYYRQDALPLLLSTVAAYLLMSLLLGSPKLSTLARPSGLTRSERRDVIRIGLAASVTAFAYSVLSSSDRLVLGSLESAHVVGLYSLGYSVGILGMVINSAIFTVWTPEAIRLAEHKSEDGFRQLGLYTEVLFAAMALVALAVAAAGGDIIRLLAAPTFHDAVIVVPIVALAVMLHGVIHLAHVVFLIEKKLPLTVPWWISGALTSVALNFLMIPALGMRGSAFALLGGSAFIAAGIVGRSRQLIAFPVSWPRLVGILLLVIAGVLWLSPAWSDAPEVSLLLKVPAGISMVAIVGFIFYWPQCGTLKKFLGGLGGQA